MNYTKIALVKHGRGDTLTNWYGWSDGLFAALRELTKNYKVKVFGYADYGAFLDKGGVEFVLAETTGPLKFRLDAYKPDVILGWGTSFHHWKELNEQEVPKILLYAGGQPDKDNANTLFDAVVVENESDKEKFDTDYVAFGTNTDLFRPMDLNKLYPSFYPAAFAKYKRHDLWSKAVPDGSLAVGHIQDHEKECMEVVKDNNHIVHPTVEMTTIPHLYNQSQGVCLTPTYMGGCQRAALEAMACNTPVLVTNDSKAAEFEGVWTCPPNSKDIQEAYLQMVTSFEMETVDLRSEYVLGKYTHKEYAENLNKVLKEVM